MIQAVTIEKAAEMLSCSKNSVRRLIASEKIAAFKIGKRGLRITVSSIQNFTESETVCKTPNVVNRHRVDNAVERLKRLGIAI